MKYAAVPNRSPFAEALAGVARLTTRATARRQAKRAHPASVWTRELDTPVLEVSVSEDPSGMHRIIGVRGAMCVANAAMLATELRAAEAGVLLHIDLTDVALVDHGGLDILEAAVDDAEALGARIQIIGLDPFDPMFSADDGH